VCGGAQQAALHAFDDGGVQPVAMDRRHQVHLVPKGHIRPCGSHWRHDHTHCNAEYMGSCLCSLLEPVLQAAWR
jgi:hypothetical protein